MRFGLLGPVLVESDGATVEITSMMPRTVLAVLLLNANAVVSFDELIEALWGANPPASATASLQNHVMRLRRTLGPAAGGRIRAVAPGYLIQVEPGELDLDDFDRLHAAGTVAAGNWKWEKAAQNLAAALDLWRGEPVADVPGLGDRVQVLALRESRLLALEARTEADLELGRHREIIGELRALAAQYPLRESFHSRLMLALYRADRQAEALDAYQQARRALVGELGVEPSVALQQLHARILSADPRLAPPSSPLALPALSTSAPAASSSAGDGAPHVGPRHQLPADTRVFTGRVHEIEKLAELARKAPIGSDAGMVLISAIDGMAGIGKTALAVHAAHNLRDQFPDGQLFVDLHGHTAGIDPLTAGDALNWFLRSLGATLASIPQDLGERAALYRSKLDGTRTLLVLDNADSAAQVRPLLPGTPGCLVLVTSRKRLTGLDDAHTLTVDTLPEADAAALLHKIAGQGRVPAHHPAIAELLSLCGHIPLAVRITAARLRHHPDLRIEDLVAQLRDDTVRLEHLQDDEHSLRAVFESSYTALPPAEQRLFRNLALVPGTCFDAYAAANLDAYDHRTAEHLLESLLSHNLLIEHKPGRYKFHDLVHVYATALSSNDPEAEREAAFDRLLDYYQYTAHVADRLLVGHSRTCAQPPAQTPAHAPIPTDRDDALTWLQNEVANVVAALPQTRPERTIALTAAFASFLRQEGPWHQAVALHRTASTLAHEHGDPSHEANALLEQARITRLIGDFTTATGLLERARAKFQALGDRHAEADTLYDLSRVNIMFSQYTDAVALNVQALKIYQDLGVRHGEADTLHDLGRVKRLLGDHHAAMALTEQALEIYRELGERTGEATALHDLGRARRAIGDYETAATLENQALELYEQLGDRLGAANALHALSRISHLVGDYPAATEFDERALTLYRALGAHHGEANVLHDLGRGFMAAGDYPAAIDTLNQALKIFQDLGTRLGEAHTLQGIGQVRHATGDYPAATALLDRALEIYQDLNHPNGIANAQMDLSRIRHSNGDLEAAAELQSQALKLFQEIGDRLGAAEVLNDMGTLTAETTGPQDALTFHRQALDIARAVHSAVEEARALTGAAHCQAHTDNRPAAIADLREALAIYQRIRATEAATVESFLAELEGGDSDID